jgi:hypothetical protein
MAPRYVRIRLPHIPSGLAMNLVGLAGLIGFAVCLGGLLGNWWVSGLTGCVFAVALCWLAGPAEDNKAEKQAAPAGAPAIRAVPAAKSG